MVRPLLRSRRLLPLALAALVLSSVALAADPPGTTGIDVESLNDGRIRIERGERSQVVDLSREVSGCKGELYDPTTGDKSWPAVELELLDQAEKDSRAYLLLLATAPSNCNVQGMCGAAPEPDATILWLKLAKDLSVEETRAAVIHSCTRFKTLRIDLGDGFDIQASDLPWSGDILTVPFEDGMDGPVRQLVYDRKDPAAGFRVVPRRAGGGFW